MDTRMLFVLLVLGVLCTVQAGNSRVQIVDEDFMDLVRAKVIIETHIQKRGQQTSCMSNPCKNGGYCSHTVTEFQTRLGLDYTCLCRGDYSGIFCDKYQSCSTCPSTTRYCQRTSKDQTGRYCFNSNFIIVV